MKSITYSQNLLIDNKLVEKIVSLSTIDQKDTVLEMGKPIRAASDRNA